MEDPLVRPKTLFWRLLRALARLQVRTRPCMAWDLGAEQRVALEAAEQRPTDRS